jgi:hypothetical protein
MNDNIKIANLSPYEKEFDWDDLFYDLDDKTIKEYGID